ncbi:hypothetical protein [Bradyrhizobium sp. NAS96.2]|nr:hypothetical protein [Bradyrhizobium sp. NAS96.2]
MLPTIVTQWIGQTPMMSIEVTNPGARLILKVEKKQSRWLNEGPHGTKHG